jgi:DNA-binding MarR family transcriptional regulator
MGQKRSNDEPATDRPVPDAGAPLKLDDFLPHQLNVVSSLVSLALTRVYAKRHGIGIPEWRILVTLGEYGVMTAKQIGSFSHMHKTKVSRAAAFLEKRKLLTRKANRDDRREAHLSLSPTGRAIYEDLAPNARDFSRRLVEAVDPGDRAAFNRALKRLTERSAELVAEVAGAPVKRNEKDRRGTRIAIERASGRGEKV